MNNQPQATRTNAGPEGSTFRRMVVPSFLVAFIAFSAMVPAGQAALPTLDASQEITYAADGRPQMEEFRSTGQVTLTVPRDSVVSPDGKITVDAVEQRIYATRDISEYRNGSWQVVGRIESINVVGVVQGHPLSMVSLLLDLNGIYGHVEVPVGSQSADFKFHPYADNPANGDLFTQHVWLNRSDVAVQLVDQIHADLNNEARAAHDEASAASEDAMDDATSPQSQNQGASSSPAKTQTQASCGSQTQEVCKARAACGSVTTSIIWMIATAGTTGFAAKHSDWQGRISSGFTDFKPMLLKDGLCIDAYIKISKTEDIVSGGPAVLSTDDCDSSTDSVVDQFQDWLHANSAAFTSAAGAAETDAYQLWTARDLESAGDGPNGYLCFGLSEPNTVVRFKQDVPTRISEALDAASVIEGYDSNCCDYYDPDEQKHRAIVSGHEISHIFGEENHPTADCPGTTQRNIMRNGTHKDVVGLCYLQSTRNEIKARYFYGQEP